MEESNTVCELKAAISKRENLSIDPSRLGLYLGKKNDQVWLTEKETKNVQSTNGLTLLHPARAKLRFFGLSEGQLGEDDDENGPVHLLVMLSAPPKPPTSKKRKLHEMKELFSPSSFARCRGGGTWVKWLKRLDGQIECHRLERSDDAMPLPLTHLNETFARLDQNCTSIEYDTTDCEFALRLCQEMSSPFESEALLAEKARKLLSRYLLDGFAVASISCVGARGSVSHGTYLCGKTPILNLQCKLQKGDGGGDPTMQNLTFYLKLLPSVIDRQFPCFLLDICGSLLTVFGVVNTSDEDVVCEPLAMSCPLLFVDNERLMVSLVRMCASLKTAIRELTEANLHNPSGQSQRKKHRVIDGNRWRFPYKDSVLVNDHRISFEYVDVIQRHVLRRSLKMELKSLPSAPSGPVLMCI